MKVAWSQSYNHPLPDGHRFPMIKYDLIPKQLLRENIISNDDIFDPNPISRIEAELAHSAEYLDKLFSGSLTRQEERATGFPFSSDLLKREMKILGGTIGCVQYALKEGIAFNAAGGTHHAFSDRGEGFCLLNDIAVSSAWALKNTSVSKILVVDLDVHQGNGTAEIFSNTPDVFTFSMHGAHNYPLKKQQSDLDVGVPDGITDEPYLETLNKHLNHLFESVRPDLVQYQCGVDVLGTDKLGRLDLTQSGCAQRDEIVLEACHHYEVPVVCTMGGGYSENIRDIVNAHCNTYKIAHNLF